MTCLRSCCAVTGKMRFLSHLDLLKMMERSLRRADLPVAFSRGFNPHPRMAFGPARPVGLSSECEYFDIELEREINPAEFRERLQENCPAGIKIKETKEISPGAPALTAVLNCASYQAEIRSPLDWTRAELERRIDDLLARQEIIVERVSPKGRKKVDIRPGIWRVGVHPVPGGASFDLDVMIGPGRNVRPGEVINALALAEGEIREIVRTGLFMRNQDGEKVRPM